MALFERSSQGDKERRSSLTWLESPLLLSSSPCEFSLSGFEATLVTDGR
jgi:hypothetical protein